MGRPPSDQATHQSDQSQDFDAQVAQEYQPDPAHQENYSDHVEEPSYYQEPQPQDQQQQYPTQQQPVQQPAQYPPRSSMQNPNQPTPAAYPPPSYPPPSPPSIHQPVQFPPPQSHNPNLQSAASYPPQGNPAQPVQFPPPHPSQNPNLQSAASYPPQGNPAQPVQFPPPHPSQNPNLQSAASYPPQPVQFPPPHPSQNPNLQSAASYPPQGNPAQFLPASTANPMYPNQNPAPYTPPHEYPIKPPQHQPVQFPPPNPGPGYNMPPAPHKSPLHPNINHAASGIPVPQVFNQNWSSGIFDCMDDPENALETTFLPCVTFGQNAEIIDNGQTTCMMNGLIYSLFLWMPSVVACGFRTKLREKYGLIEDPANDFITHLLFPCCALCQEYRELKHRGFDPAIGWQANMQTQNAPQVPMTPPVNQRMGP